VAEDEKQIDLTVRKEEESIRRRHHLMRREWVLDVVEGPKVVE
jgi:hypothetical protein